MHYSTHYLTSDGTAEVSLSHLLLTGFVLHCLLLLDNTVPSIMMNSVTHTRIEKYSLGQEDSASTKPHAYTPLEARHTNVMLGENNVRHLSGNKSW